MPQTSHHKKYDTHEIENQNESLERRIALNFFNRAGHPQDSNPSGRGEHILHLLEVSVLKLSLQQIEDVEGRLSLLVQHIPRSAAKQQFFGDIFDFIKGLNISSDADNSKVQRSIAIKVLNIGICTEFDQCLHVL